MLAPAPAPVEEPEWVEPDLDLNELDEVADRIAESAKVGEVEQPTAPPQKIFKLTQFIKDLKADYSDAKRFDIYFFTDRIHKIENPWTNQAANIS
jgi:hypothetical protein